jgi:hypothetical protein
MVIGSTSLLLPLALALGLAACSAPPPRPWLRYELTATDGWTPAGEGAYTSRVLGADLRIDLHRRETRVELQIENKSGRELRLAVGPEALNNPSAAIGQVQRRPMGGGRGEDVPDYIEYLSMQPIEVRDGWRCVFYLDSPLGRDPTIGQYLVLVIEASTGQARERKLLPLVATNAGATSRTLDPGR